MGTVAVAFFGGGDEPGKAIAAFGRFAVLSLFLAAILAYGLLPLANDFPTFLIVMGLFMLPIGMWAAANPMGVLVLAFGLSNINLQGHYMPYDFAFFLEVGDRKSVVWGKSGSVSVDLGGGGYFKKKKK